MINFDLLTDRRLLFVVLISGVVSMLGSLNIASRPAAVITGKVAQATTISSIFFMVSRLANMFYLPLMAGFVGEAVRTGDTTQLLQQIQFVVVGSALGSLASWILLPNFVSLFCYLVEQLNLEGIKSFFKPRVMRQALGKFLVRYPLRARLGQLAGIPRGFLVFNVLATAIWTIGALSAVYCSGAQPEYSSTALLLSGLVNSFAAIAFSVWVDPQAAIITDDVVHTIKRSNGLDQFESALLKSPEVRVETIVELAKSCGLPPELGLQMVRDLKSDGRVDQFNLQDPQLRQLLDGFFARARAEKRREPEQVFAAAIHLGAGNFVGAILGLGVLHAGIYVITKATEAIGAQGGHVASSIWPIVALNAGLTILASTTYASRVSAVITRKVAVALAVYNLFFLITRLSQQVYGPLLGSTADHLVKTNQVVQLEALFRWILAGASLGSFLGLLLLPTFVEVINKAVAQISLHNSVPKVLALCLLPKNWPAVMGCLRPPGLLGVRLSDIRKIPGFFLLGNVVVLSIHSMGTMAAICAGAQLHDSPGAARSATLLSSVVNGVATIMLSLVVDPTLARITDQCSENRRDFSHIRIAAVFLLGGMLVGTLLSQVLFVPAVWFIKYCATYMMVALKAVK